MFLFRDQRARTVQLSVRWLLFYLPNNPRSQRSRPVQTLSPESTHLSLLQRINFPTATTLHPFRNSRVTAQHPTQWYHWYDTQYDTSQSMNPHTVLFSAESLFLSVHGAGSVRYGTAIPWNYDAHAELHMHTSFRKGSPRISIRDALRRLNPNNGVLRALAGWCIQCLKTFCGVIG